MVIWSLYLDMRWFIMMEIIITHNHTQHTHTHTQPACKAVAVAVTCLDILLQNSGQYSWVCVCLWAWEDRSSHRKHQGPERHEVGRARGDGWREREREAIAAAQLFKLTRYVQGLLETVRLRLGTEISYWSCLPIPNLPLPCPPPPPLLWDRKSLFCWFLLFFICSPLPRSFPGSRFRHTPLFIPYIHPCFTFAVLCFQEPGFRGFDQFSLLTVALWLVNLLPIYLSLLIFELLLFLCLPITLLNSVFFPIHCLPSTLPHSRLPCCSFLTHEWFFLFHCSRFISRLRPLSLSCINSAVSCTN